MLKPGDFVIFHDTYGKAHNALLTNVFSSGVGKDNVPFYDDTGCMNLVYVSENEAEIDNGGRQIKRASSVSHVSKTNVHGYYWRKPDEQPNKPAPSMA